MIPAFFNGINMINWEEPPFTHKWEKNVNSILNPIAKVTWPQFIVEMLIWNRMTYIKGFQKPTIGEGWSNSMQKQVKTLCQQANIISNYFPHPNDEPLVVVAFKNFFRTNRVMKMGQPKFTRVTKTGKSTITQDEKHVVNGVMAELKRLQEQRNVFAAAPIIDIKTNGEEITFRKQDKNANTSSLQKLMDLEKQIKEKNGQS